MYVYVAIHVLSNLSIMYLCGLIKLLTNFYMKMNFETPKLIHEDNFDIFLTLQISLKNKEKYIFWDIKPASNKYSQRLKPARNYYYNWNQELEESKDSLIPKGSNIQATREFR